MRRTPLTVAVVTGLLAPATIRAQDPPAAAAQAWNSARALELVERARVRRSEPVADSALRNYRADATGHVYFFLDREDQGEPVLLRADQVALELYWSQPGRVKQVIRGMRSEEQLPIKNFAYYLDRYTVIQNGFDDVIRVGEGRDISAVPHPLAAGADQHYRYRLADSLEIRLPARPEPIRVYEIQVRPVDFGRPAIVGSLFLEQARGDLVRLAFTFTPSSYLDPRNERVEIALENALWEDRYWLPREQRLLVRREIPELDLDVGTVIRASLRVTGYEFNTDIPTGFFAGRSVIVAAGPRGLERYPFEEGLFEGLEDLDMPAADPATLDEVDVSAITGRIIRQRYLRGVPRVRFYAPGVSAVLRYDRAEGTVTGAGWSFGLGDYQLDAYGGYAWRAEKPTASLGFHPLSASGGGFSADAYYRRHIDLGLRPATDGVSSSLAAAGFGTDYRDLYFASGAALRIQLRTDDMESRADLRWERHQSADPTAAAVHSPWNESSHLRPVLPVDEGDQVTLALTGRRPVGPVDARFGVETGWFDGELYSRLSVDAVAGWRGADRRWAVDARLTARDTDSDIVQHRWLVGGPNDLPGHPLHGYLADNIIMLDAEAWRTVVPRWLRLRAFAVAAAVSTREITLPVVPGTDSWTLPEIDAGLGSVGIGLGTLDGILRLDFALPFGGRADRQAALILSIDPRFWPML